MPPHSSSSSPSSSDVASPLWSPSSSYHSSTRTTPISSAHGSSAGLSGMTMSALPEDQASVAARRVIDREEEGYVVEGSLSPQSESSSPALPWASSEWDDQAFGSILGRTGIGLGLGTDLRMGEEAKTSAAMSDRSAFHLTDNLDPDSDATDVCSPISNTRTSSLRWPSTTSRPPLYPRASPASTSLPPTGNGASGTYRRTSRIISFATEYDYDGQPSSTTLHGSQTEQTWSAGVERSWRHSLPSRYSTANIMSGNRSSPNLGSNASSASPSPIIPQGIPSTPLRAGTRAARTPPQSAPNTRHNSRAPSRTTSSANLHASVSGNPGPPKSSRTPKNDVEIHHSSSPAQDESHAGKTIRRGSDHHRSTRNSFSAFASPPLRPSSRYYDYSDASSATQTPQANSSSDFTRAAGTSSSAASTPRVRAQSAFTSRTTQEAFRSRPKDDLPRRPASAHSKSATASQQRPLGGHKRTWSTFGHDAASRPSLHPRSHPHSTAHSISGHLIPAIPAIQDIGKSELVVSARRYAQNLTVPLKPMAQALVLVTVSSAAVFGFLVLLAVSYALTAMDDFEKRVKGVNDAAFTARKSATSSVERGRHVLEQAKASAVQACAKAVSAGIQAVSDRTADVRDRVISLAGSNTKPVAEPKPSRPTPAGTQKRVRRHRRKAGVPFLSSATLPANSNPAQQYLSDADDPDVAQPPSVRSARPASSGNGGPRSKRTSPRGSPPKTGSTISLPGSVTDASSAADNEQCSSDSEEELDRSPVSHALPYFGFAYRSSVGVAAAPCWTSTTGCAPSTSKAGAESYKQQDRTPSAGHSSPSAGTTNGPARPPLSILLPSLVIMIFIATLSGMVSMITKWLERDVPSRSWRNRIFGKDKGKGRA